MPGSIRVARVAGIPLGIHPLWFAVVALITWSLGEAYYPDEIAGIAPLASYALGFASALLLFASVLLHELGHALVARRYGVRIDEIDLWLLGGVAVMRDGARRPQEELRFALAGPAVTVVIATVCGALAVLLSYTSLTAARALLEYQAIVNIVIVAFNLLPAFPLDGGRVARAVLWQRKGNKVAATVVAAGIGRAFAWGFIVLALVAVAAGVPSGLWFGLIGLFLLLASRAELQQARLQEIFAGRRANQLISHPAVVLRGDLTVEEAVRDYFVPLGYTAFPVADLAGKPLGLLSLRGVQAVPAAERSRVLVADLADRDPDLFVDQDEDVAEILGRPAFVRVGRAIVVGPSGEASGLLSITDVERAVRATWLAGANGSGRGTPAAPGAKR